ncbi:MAG TPA: hypothetical protein VGZ52_06730 [Acidimicrobiales bacterium]|jgi:hypothetical protein|nr:hypothetical protein [Acidimicrobiales bacterium]
MSKSKVAALVLVVLAVAACSGSDKKPAPGTSGNAASQAAATTTTAIPTASSGPSITLFAAEPAPNAYTLDTGGTHTVESGSAAVSFTNTGRSGHEARIVRINDNDFEAFRSAVLAQGADAVSTLATDAFSTGPVVAGGSTTGTATLTPGTYAILDLLLAPDGQTFAQHGMLEELVVTPSAIASSSSGSAGPTTTAVPTNGGSTGSSSSSNSTSAASSQNSSSGATTAN